MLSAGVLMELDEVLGALEQDRPRGVIVVSAKKSGFIAGADIKELEIGIDPIEVETGVSNLRVCRSSLFIYSEMFT